MRKCTRCEAEKPSSSFHNAVAKQCKECYKQYYKQKMEMVIQCTKCGNNKPSPHFYKGSNECKSCHKQQHREKIAKSTKSNYSAKKKVCTLCLEEKPLESFLRGETTKYTDRQGRCKECRSFAYQQRKKLAQEKREQEKEREREALLAMPYKARVKHIERKKLASHVKVNYGIKIEVYDEILQLQGGVCAICHNPPDAYEKLVVDHNHTTGHVRGLLCKSCNWGLGQFRDSPENLLNAAKYLKKSTWEE